MYIRGGEWEVLIPEVYMGVVWMGVLLYGSVKGSKGVEWLGGLGLIMGGVLCLNNEFGEAEVLGGSMIHNSMTATCKGLILLFGGLCVLGGSERGKGRGGVVMSESAEGRVGPIPERELSAGGRLEYVMLLMLSSLGVEVMCGANDMLMVYLGMEMQTLALYVIAGWSGGGSRSYGTEAGLKYFIMGAIGSGLLLFGVSMMYGGTGTTNIGDWGMIGEGMGIGYVSEEFRVGMLLVVTGLVFKLGGAPYHMWIPDVYEGASRRAVMYMAVVPKLGILGVLIKLGGIEGEEWTKWMIIMGVGSMLVSVNGALYQGNIKRFMAYSGIGHIGYMLVGLGVGSVEGVSGVVEYMVLYMVTSLAIWLVIGKMKGGKVEKIEELSGIGRRGGVWEGVVLGIGMLSVAGVPPMAGFFGKMYVFMAAVEGGLSVVALIGLVTSVVSGYYYLRILKVMYFEDGGKEVSRGEVVSEVYGEEAERSWTYIVGVCLLVIVCFVLNPGVLLEMGHSMAL